ncbi:MAG: 2-oxoacid:ferredoxin oxidoreductase subunit beta [Negativicutes bacterium]|nr:2-oxoacid:ferredoxin oxidoreductase subunit beta [Negativicutes bacterium]
MSVNWNGNYQPTWCPGCGDWGILNGMKRALTELELNPDQTAIVTGIGCSSKIAQYLNGYRLETLHGRALPNATGVKLVNPELTVIVNGGDGDGMGIGRGHFAHTARRNLDITYFIHNNQIYGLTKGQTSPTSEMGMVTGFTPAPMGNVENPINIVRTAIADGATFVARTYCADVPHMVEVMKAAVLHKGFAVVDILQPCVSFNQLNTYGWYKERVYRMDEEGYDRTNWNQAIEAANEWGEKIPTGIFYQVSSPTLDAEMGRGNLSDIPENGNIVDKLFASFG